MILFIEVPVDWEGGPVDCPLVDSTPVKCKGSSKNLQRLGSYHHCPFCYGCLRWSCRYEDRGTSIGNILNSMFKKLIVQLSNFKFKFMLPPSNRLYYHDTKNIRCVPCSKMNFLCGHQITCLQQMSS